MRHLLFAVLALVLCARGHAQLVDEQVFYKDAEGTKQVEQKKADYVEETTYQNDSVKTMEFRYLKTKELVWSAEFRKDKPTDSWHLWNWNYRDFIPFKTLYRNHKPSGYYYFNAKTNQLDSVEVTGFVAPKLSPDDRDLIDSCDWTVESGFNRLVAEAINMDNVPVSGKVAVQFSIDETGKVGYVGVLKGPGKLMDAEAFRVVSLLPQFVPATLNGENFPVYLRCLISFKVLF